MYRKHFASFVFLLLFVLLFFNNAVAQTTSVTNHHAFGYIEVTVTALDTNTSVTTAKPFSLGNYYNFSSYPIQIDSKVINGGTGSDKPYVTTYLNGSLDNANWDLKIDTLVTSDSVSTYHRTSSDFNSKYYNYYTLTFSTTTSGCDSINVYQRYHYKKD